MVHFSERFMLFLVFGAVHLVRHVRRRMVKTWMVISEPIPSAPSPVAGGRSRKRAPRETDRRAQRLVAATCHADSATSPDCIPSLEGRVQIVHRQTALTILLCYVV